ncbi:MAG: hypothetical protein OXI01_23355 [Albidovulum sp.]|nr:hypothetical protein [Albidovulum sp.]
MLNISRARGRNQQFEVETLSGRNLVMNADGSMTNAKPFFKKRKRGERTEVKIRARTKRELRRIVSGLKDEFPQIDVEEVVKRAERTREYFSEPYAVTLNVGGLLAGRSIVKSCLAMLYDTGLSIDDCEEAKLYLIEDKGPCFGYGNKRDFVKNRPANTFLHCIHVCGDSEMGRVLGYAEYFGWLRFVACLSRNYDGKAFSHCYAVDPVLGRELDLDVNLLLNAADFAEIFEQKEVDFRDAGRDLEALVRAWRKVDLERARIHAIEDALKSACEESGIEEGDILSDEEAAVFAQAVSERLVPFLVHTINGLRFTEEELSEVERKLKAGNI